MFAQCAIGASMIAFGGLNWALDGAAAPVAAVLRLEPAMAPAGALRSGDRERRPALPAREIRFRDVTFAYPGGAPVLDSFDLTIPAGSSLAIVGQNGAGKTTLAKLLCRLTTRNRAPSRSTASTCASSTSPSWRVAPDGRLPGLHALRAAAARQRRAGRRAG